MQAGGPSYAVELGRLDGLSSTASSVDGKLPPPSFNLDQLTSLFAANNLSQTDMIALSGKQLIMQLFNSNRYPEIISLHFSFCTSGIVERNLYRLVSPCALFHFISYK